MPGRPSFLDMPKEALREAAARGGRNAHAMGTANEWNSEQAKAAARKSAEVRRSKRDARLAEETAPAAKHYGRRFP